MKSFKLFFLFFIIFICGLLSFFAKSYIKQIEIIPAETEMQASITTSLFYPFNTREVAFIPNLKQAVITTSEKHNGKTKYRVELENFQGERVAISKYSGKYESEKELQKSINESIEKRNHFIHIARPYEIFKYTITFVVMFLFIINSGKILKSYIGVLKSENTQSTETEPEKYKDINDSIIK